MNVFTRKINTDLSVKVDDTFRLGEDQMKKSQKSLPGEFYDTVSGKVKTMADGKKGMKAGKKIIHDLEVIYAHALAL